LLIQSDQSDQARIKSEGDVKLEVGRGSLFIDGKLIGEVGSAELKVERRMVELRGKAATIKLLVKFFEDGKPRSLGPVSVEGVRIVEDDLMPENVLQPFDQHGIPMSPRYEFEVTQVDPSVFVSD
jgi:hypothetical protein